MLSAVPCFYLQVSAAAQSMQPSAIRDMKEMKTLYQCTRALRRIVEHVEHKTT